ncbi:hypothetical protein AMJ86_03800 [bacterium SM23_57]|jgi:hypothetical protein|nr:MAG: hypothetical protein AMJ86_03800 [bacterium SM23_57]
MSSAEFDLGYLKAGIQEIEPYLLSKNLFWTLSTHPAPGSLTYPRLTLGGLLLSVARLKARILPRSHTFEFRSLEKNLDHWRRSWRTFWERKASQEMTSRLRQWELYLDEILLKPDVHIPYYGSEVRVRVVIELLTPEISPQNDDILPKIQQLDGFLKSIIVPGEFIWENELAMGFNQTDYWYLWGVPEIKKLPMD